MTLLDTNVLLDIATADPVWSGWSEAQLRSASLRGAVCINPIIYAELAPAFASSGDLDHWLAPGFFNAFLFPTPRVGSRRRLF
jgi:hypothetical protein